MDRYYAILTLQEIVDCCELACDEVEYGERKEAVQMAIDALKADEEDDGK